MPFTLPPLSRRQFLAASALSALAASRAWGEDKKPASDPHKFVIFSDTHIASAPETKRDNTNMHDNLVQVVKEILALEVRPSHAMHLGDCAYKDGQPAEYALLLKILEPVRTAGLPLHLIMGNHDHRENFWKAMPADDLQDKAVEAKHVLVVKSERANWFLLDSLDAPEKTPGKLGEKQLEWLGKALDAHTDKPALVCVHHQPDLTAKPQGLTDTKPLYEVIVPRKHVKAMFFGHTHNWNIKEHEGLHLVNLPPTAYPFTRGLPNGFIELSLEADAAKIKLTTIDKNHAQNGKETTLKWRA